MDTTFLEDSTVSLKVLARAPWLYLFARILDPAFKKKCFEDGGRQFYIRHDGHSPCHQLPAHLFPFERLFVFP